MSEHTPGFYQLELRRTKRAHEESRLIYENSLNRTEYNKSLLVLMQKFHSDGQSYKKIQRTIKQYARITKYADNTYCACTIDYLMTQSQLPILEQDIIDTAEDLAYTPITQKNTSPKKHWWQLISKQR